MDVTGLIKNKRFWCIVLVLPVWFLLHSLVITVDGLTADADRADVLVVLGNKVEINGHPSRRLQDRLDKAFELFQAGVSQRIIVSGGFGKEGHDEATVMADYLRGLGVASEALIIDSDGVNTIATARFTRQYMQDQQLQSAIMVSQFYHLTRCKLALEKCGITQAQAVAADYRFEIFDPLSIFREFFAYYKYLLWY